MLGRAAGDVDGASQGGLPNIGWCPRWLTVRFGSLGKRRKGCADASRIDAAVADVGVSGCF